MMNKYKTIFMRFDHSTFYRVPRQVRRLPASAEVKLFEFEFEFMWHINTLRLAYSKEMYYVVSAKKLHYLRRVSQPRDLTSFTISRHLAKGIEMNHVI